MFTSIVHADLADPGSIPTAGNLLSAQPYIYYLLIVLIWLKSDL